MTQLQDRVLGAIFRRFPPKGTIFKATPGRAESEHSNEVNMPFSRYYGLDAVEMFKGRDILDLGCGFGGRPVRFCEFGARSVLGVEISGEKVAAAAAFAADRQIANAAFRVGVGEEIPAPDGSVDLITMYDVLEHVVDPAATVRECHRVLRPGGQLATVFPPYYSLLSGSHLNGYATSVPGLNILFPTRALRRAALAKMEAEGHDYRAFLRDVPTDKLWNLNGLTVRGFKRIVREVAFSLADVRFVADLDHRQPRERPGRLWRLRTPPVSYLMLLPAQIPVVQEAACWRIVALLTK